MNRPIGFLALVLIAGLVGVNAPAHTAPVVGTQSERAAVETPTAAATRAAPSKMASAKSLAKKVRAGKSLHASVVAVRRVLAQAGVGTVKGRRTVTQGQAPRTGTKVWATDAYVMAGELWRKPNAAGDRSWRDVAKMLKTAEVLPGAKSDKLVVRLVNKWVRLAKRAPKAVDSFVPLFLAKMAKPRHVNLAKPFKPARVRLSGLEWMLFWNAVARSGKTWTDGAGQRRRAGGDLAALAPAKGPCSQLKDDLDQLVPPFVKGDAKGVSVKTGGDVFKEAFKAILEKAGGKEHGKDFKDSVTRTLKLAQILHRLHATMLLFKTMHVAILPGGEPGPGEVKRPFRNPVDYTFLGQAGLSPQAERELKASDPARLHDLRDCVRAAGIPWFNDVADVADDIETWRLQWQAKGSPAWAVVNVPRSNFDAGVFKHKVKIFPALDKLHGYANLHIDVLPYQDKRDPDTPRFAVEWPVRVDLLANKPPDTKAIKAIVTSAMGGAGEFNGGGGPFDFRVAIADAIADILLNWALIAASPNATNYVDIIDPMPCDANTQGLMRLQVIRQVSGPACEEPIYLKVEGSTMNGVWNLQAGSSLCGTITGTGSESVTTGPERFDPALGRLSEGGSAQLVTSGDVEGSDSLVGCRFEGGQLVPCTINTSHDGFPGGLNLRLTRPVGSSDVEIRWRTQSVSFGNVGNNDCLAPVFSGSGDEAVTRVPLAQLSEPGVLRFTASRVDHLTGGPPVEPITVTGSASMTIQVRRMNANGTPYTGN